MPAPRALLGESPAVGDATACVDGYRLAMGAVIALIGAGVSLGRGPVQRPAPVVVPEGLSARRGR